jgi:hypothetical protein
MRVWRNGTRANLGSSVFDVGVQVPSPAPRGSSSVVEHHLAKVGVAGSNPVFRSIFIKIAYAGVAELADAQDLKSCGR